MRALDDAPSLEHALRALGSLVEDVRPVRLLGRQARVDREAVYSVIDEVRAALPESIVELRRLQDRRAQDGDPPLGDEPVDTAGFLDAIFGPLDGLDDLVHRAAGAPFSDRVRVSRERFSDLAGRLRSALEPMARELAYARGIYGDELSAANERDPGATA